MALSGIALKDHPLNPVIVIAGIASRLPAHLHRFGWMSGLVISNLPKVHRPYTNPQKRGDVTSAQSVARNCSSRVSMNRILSSHTSAAWMIQTLSSPLRTYGPTGSWIGSSSTTNYHGTPEIYPKKSKSALTTVKFWCSHCRAPLVTRLVLRFPNTRPIRKSRVRTDNETPCTMTYTHTPREYDCRKD